MEQGYFITFEGGDGSGKSTQIKKLKTYLQARGYQVTLTREPGGTEIGEKIREIILDPASSEMSAMAEALLYAACRAQHIAQVIKPALESGNIVICDRFVDSSIAYQGYGRGLGEAVRIMNQYAVGECMPDLTFLMKLAPSVGSRRIAGRKKDRIECEADAFHQAVYQGYEELERLYADRIIGIDASASIEAIEAEINRHIEDLLQRHTEKL